MPDERPIIDTLTLAPEAVLIVYQPVFDEASDERMDTGAIIVSELRRREMPNLVLVIPPGTHIEALSEAMMARHGWYRRAQKRAVETNPNPDVGEANEHGSPRD